MSTDFTKSEREAMETIRDGLAAFAMSRLADTSSKMLALADFDESKIGYAKSQVLIDTATHLLAIAIASGTHPEHRGRAMDTILEGLVERTADMARVYDGTRSR